MDATIIIAIVPVVLLVAYIVWLIRAKITEGRDIDLREPVTALVICLVAVLIIGAMTSSTVTYTYSEETNTLYINQNLIDRNQPFDSYGDEIKSVVIGNNCRVLETGTLDSLTNLEYVSIGDNVEVRAGAFGMTFKDPEGTEISAAPGEYIGYDGGLYSNDPEIFTYTTSGSRLFITGLADSDAKFIVVPRERNGNPIVRISDSAFASSEIVFFGALPDSNLESFGNSVFNGSTSLKEARIPDSLTSCGNSTFRDCSALEAATVGGSFATLQYSFFHGCVALEAVDIPDTITLIRSSAFRSCESLTEIDLPSGLSEIEGAAFQESGLTALSSSTLETIGGSTFSSCAALETVSLSGIKSIGAQAFSGCTGITQVGFGASLTTLAANSFSSWTFYASDGTTTVDKTVASNLAGKTFMGTAAALVEVAPGQLSLSPLQLQQVQLHTQELQDQPVSFDPLPFQPTVQTQDQEPVAA